MNNAMEERDPTTEAPTPPTGSGETAKSGEGTGAGNRTETGSDRQDSAGERKTAVKPRRRLSVQRESRCRFCRERVTRVDYKDIIRLQALCRSQGRIIAGKRSGNCAWHQRMVKRAIKQARFIGLMSHVDGPGRPGGRTGRGW